MIRLRYAVILVSACALLLGSQAAWRQCWRSGGSTVNGSRGWRQRSCTSAGNDIRGGLSQDIRFRDDFNALWVEKPRAAADLARA